MMSQSGNTGAADALQQLAFLSEAARRFEGSIARMKADAEVFFPQFSQQSPQSTIGDVVLNVQERRVGAESVSCREEERRRTTQLSLEQHHSPEERDIVEQRGTSDLTDVPQALPGNHQILVLREVHRIRRPEERLRAPRDAIDIMRQPDRAASTAGPGRNRRYVQMAGEPRSQRLCVDVHERQFANAIPALE